MAKTKTKCGFLAILMSFSVVALTACGVTEPSQATQPQQSVPETQAQQPSDAASAQDNNGTMSRAVYDNSPITMPEMTQASIPELTQRYYDNGDVTYPAGAAESQSQSQNTVYFDDPIGWGDTYIYYWSDANKNMIKWPGEKMESFEGVWRYTLPEGVEYIIFSNGALQTRDVPYNPAQTNYRLSANRDQDKSYYVEDWQGNVVDSSRVDPKGKYN